MEVIYGGRVEVIDGGKEGGGDGGGVEVMERGRVGRGDGGRVEVMERGRVEVMEGGWIGMLWLCTFLSCLPVYWHYVCQSPVCSRYGGLDGSS